MTETTSLADLAYIFDEAAEQIERNGLNKDGYWWAGPIDTPYDQRRCCTEGAVRVRLAAHNVMVWPWAYDPVLTHLQSVWFDYRRENQPLFRTVIQWSDKEATAEQAAAFLRQCAERARSEPVPR